MRIGKGRCNGTFGELLQGELNGRPFLVTLPIDALQSKAVFLPSLTESQVLGAPYKLKATQACEKLLELFDIRCGGTLKLASNIPVGKGLASSSADIVAAIRATAASFDLPVTAEIISAIACEIEPTDGVMYQDAVSYDHVHGELIESLGSLPSFGLLGIDVGGIVDTIRFNRLVKSYDVKDRQKFSEAYELVKLGIRTNNLAPIFQASTISARINQKLLPNPHFSQFEKLALKYNAGVVVAHSGTVIGILFDPDQQNMKEFVGELAKEIAMLVESEPFLHLQRKPNCKHLVIVEQT